MMSKGLLFVVSGPSGVGKSTLCKKMASIVQGTTLSVSFTTRNPRPGEEEGVDYFFVKHDRFRELVEQDEFVEWATVYGNYYGTPRSYLKQTMEKGIDVLLDIDVQGARQIMKRFSDAVYVFVVPPSLDTLRDRLVQRGAEASEEVDRRFQKATAEIMNYHSYHYIIRNDDLSGSARALEAVIVAERLKTSRVSKEWLVEKGLLREGEGSKV